MISRMAKIKRPQRPEVPKMTDKEQAAKEMQGSEDRPAP